MYIHFSKQKTRNRVFKVLPSFAKATEGTASLPMQERACTAKLRLGAKQWWVQEDSNLRPSA